MSTRQPSVAKGCLVGDPVWPLLVALIGLAAVFLVFVAATFRTASAETSSATIRWFNPIQACRGECAAHLAFGRLVDEDMTASFGLNDDLEPDGGAFVAPWRYDFEDSYIVSAALSRQVFSVGSWLSGTVEAGVGQRMGDLRATEIWAALYLRWHAFPWSETLRTRVGISTGLNYATRIEAWERRNDRRRAGAHLLHYLAPELSLGLPDVPEWDLVMRYHHRSGGGKIFGDTALFGGVTGASNHVMIGLRRAF